MRKTTWSLITDVVRHEQPECTIKFTDAVMKCCTNMEYYGKMIYKTTKEV